MDRFKRVKWASDDLLCQVKLFLSEDCPSQIGSEAEDHLQIKTSLHSNGMNVDDLPPGFGGKGPSYTPNQICVSQIRWNRPPMFTLNGEWHVVAGEESEERGTQNYREMRVLEALYPRVSAIPPSPSVSPELEACYYDDSQTPIIPLNSTEDEDTTPPIESTPSSNSASAVESNSPIDSKASIHEKLHGIVAGLDADVIAAASAAYTASLKSNEKGSLVDTDLLIRILNEPKMIEALTKGSGSSVTSIYEPKPEPKASDPMFTFQPFHGPTTSWPNAKPCTVTSSERSNDNLKPFSTCPIPYSDTCSHTRPLGPMQENGYMIRENRSNGGKPLDSELDLSRKILPASNSAIFGSNQRNLDLQFSQPSLDLTKTFPPKPEDMYASHRPNVGPTVPHMSMGSSQYSSPQPDRFTLPSIRAPAPAAKDVNYYKSLIRLHGSGAEEPTQVSLPELPPVSGQGHARTKSLKPCKFFNTSKGCRYGLSCPFEHVPLLDLRPGNYPDNDRNKRLKISSDSLDKC